MGKTKDIAGNQYGRLTAVRPTGEFYRNSAVWLCSCSCSCGETKEVTVRALGAGDTKSCGCLQRQVQQKNSKNLVGRKFGKLEVLEKSDRRSPGRMILWKCVCECGEETYVETKNLSNGSTKSCGCLAEEARRRPKKDLTGRKIGDLTVLGLSDNRINNELTWRAKCVCGKLVDLPTRYFRHRMDCGCSKTLVGKKFERLTVLKLLEEKTNFGGSIYLCECSCGTKKPIPSDRLKSGNTKSCGCLRVELRSKPRKKIVGNRYGKLVALKRVGKDKWGSALVLCQCDCGNKITVIMRNLGRGTSSCGCTRGYDDKTRSSFNDYFASCKRDAEIKRGRKWGLDEVEFRRLTQSNCNYCGKKPSRKHLGTRAQEPYTCNGIDRIDNNLDYVGGNCVPCCKECNNMKWTYPVSTFLKQVELIYKYNFP